MTDYTTNRVQAVVDACFDTRNFIMNRLVNDVCQIEEAYQLGQLTFREYDRNLTLTTAHYEPQLARVFGR